MTDTALHEAADHPDIAYEPYSNESRIRQFEIYKQLRAQAPVFHTESDWWCISRYEDIRQVLMSPERFSSGIIQEEAFGIPTEFDLNMEPEKLELLFAMVMDMPVPIDELIEGRVIVAADPPDHTRMRRIVNRGFTARRMEQLRPKVEEIVAKLLVGIESADTFEVVSRLAEQVPVRVMADFLSADEADLDRIKGWSDTTMDVSSGEHRGTADGQAMLLTMLKEFGDYFVPRIESRRENPQDDLISDLVKASEAETLTVTEALMFLLSIMVAGNESTAGLIGSTVVTLLENPDQLALLEEDPSLCRSAVQEVLRFRSPFQFYWRKCVVETEIAGVTIPEGARVLVMPGSGNMDPEMFPDPDRFDIRRDVSKTPILTFGKGIHHCLGAYLAPLEAEIALRGILPHLSRFRLSDDALEFPSSFITYGYRRIRLVAKEA